MTLKVLIKIMETNVWLFETQSIITSIIDGKYFVCIL